jgi:hypothetical protein
VSKRSYRRLAAVVGAALAVGTMAPAMAARVVGADSADAGVSVNTIDITDVTGMLPLGQQDLGGLGLGSVTGIADGLLTTATGAPQLVLGTALGVAQSALCIPTGLVGTALGTSIDAVANLHVGLGSLGAGAGVGSLLGVPFAAVGTVTNCALGLVDTALTTVGTVQATAAPIITTGLDVVGGVAATATGLPQVVLGLPSAVFGLGDLLSVDAAGHAGLGAALVGIL